MADYYDNLPKYESLDSDIIFRIYFIKYREDRDETSIKFKLGPDYMGMTTDLAIKIQRVRSIIFAKVRPTQTQITSKIHSDFSLSSWSMV